MPNDTEGHAATLDEYLRGLEGLDYPTSRSAAMNRAKDTGGLDAEVLHVLEQLPDRTYESREDLLAARARHSRVPVRRRRRVSTAATRTW